jgi:hypothetical protein
MWFAYSIAPLLRFGLPRRLNVVQVTFASDNSDDLDAVAQPSKENHVASATEASTRLVILRCSVLTDLWVLRQRLTRCLDFF